MPHFFKSIRIQNLLSFGPDSPELELKPINIVIGPNGSGKSNLLAAISLLLDRNTRSRIIYGSGGMRVWQWNHDTEVESRIHLSRNNSTPISLALLYPTGLKNGLGYKQDIYVDSVFFFNNWQFGPTAPVRQPQPTDYESKELNADACNLPHILKRIKADVRSHSIFLEFLRELYENVKDIDVKEAEGYLFLYLVEEGGLRIPAARISDGTLRYLALLAILCDPEPPNLICLEEPEMGLHPDLIQVVAKAIRYASERTQIIATTHSVSLVDDFTDSPESIVVCEKIDGSTELRRLDPAEMAPWLEKYRLGDLWTSGEIGGNRW